MKSFRAQLVASSVSIALALSSVALAQDASVDKLISKLPPPEKLAKPPMQRALEQADPAEKDPLCDKSQWR